MTHDAARLPPDASEPDDALDPAVPRIRSMRADDLARETRFVDELSEESRYQRLFSPRRLSPEELERLTRPDPQHERALVATVGRGEDETFVGVARYAVSDCDPTECEFAIVIADAWQHHGLGHRLLAALVDEARKAGLRRIMGYTFMTNLAMRELAHDLGFALKRHEEDGTLVVMSRLL